MSIEFENPLTAGTVLVREQIQSQNYAEGSAGWVIKANGDAEFNSVVIRGGTVVSGLALYYDGTPALGNLILSIAAAAGIDAYGNAYPQGFSVYGADGQLTADGSTLWVTGSNGSQVALSTGGVGQADIFLTPQDLTGTSWYDANVATTLGASNRPGLQLRSPAAMNNAFHATMTMFGGGPTTTDTSILFGADRVNFSDLVQVTGDIEIGGDVSAANVQSGSFSITPTVAGQWTSNLAVTFPSAFTTAPVVMVTPSGGGPGTGTTTDLQWQVTGTTTTGFNCRILRGNTNATTLSYLAVST